MEEVLDSYTEEELFENAMNMMDIDRSEELAGLKAFLDGSDNPLSSYDNPLGGNRIIAQGSIGRWDGTSHGMTVYRDFDDMMSGPDSVFKDCEIGKVWDENGSLFIHGYHHDGGVDVEVRQLTDAGEDALDVIEDAWYGEPFTVNDKEYDGSWKSMDAAMRDLWENPDLCPAPRYMELAFGCPAEEYEAPVIDPLLETAEFTSSAIMMPMATVRKEAALWISTTRPRSCVLFRQSRTTPMYRVGPVKPSRTRCARASPAREDHSIV